MRISLGILFISFKCGLLSPLQALAYPSQDARKNPRSDERGLDRHPFCPSQTIDSEGFEQGSIFLDPPGNSPLWSGERPYATARLAEQYEREQMQLAAQVETVTGNMQQLGTHVMTLNNAYENLSQNVNEMINVSNALVKDLNELIR